MRPTFDLLFKDGIENAVKVFRGIELDAILSKVANEGYTSIAQALFREARQAEKEEDFCRSAILMLFERVCWTHVSSTKRGRASDENIVGSESGQASQEEISDLEILFLKEIVEYVENLFLKGKIANLIWKNDGHREVRFALLAIDSYTSIPLDADSWFDDGQECFERAIDLCRRLGKATRDRLPQIESSLIEALEEASAERGFYGYLLAETLMSTGLAKGQMELVAGRLRALAQQFSEGGNFLAAGQHYSASAKWLRMLGDEEKRVEVIVLEGEMFEKESKARLESEDPSYRVAAGFLEDAVQIYRRIPRSHRKHHQVDQKILELRKLINEYNPKAMSELKTIQVPGVDVSEIIEHSRFSVSGLPWLQALKSFADLHRTDVEELRRIATVTKSQFPLQDLFSRVYLGPDGRVVSKNPGSDASTSSEREEAEIYARMIELPYRITVSVAVQSKLLPALSVLRQEHSFVDEDFVDIARQSPIVPKGREVVYGRALSLGFNEDFMVAIYLLAPQVEHLVRFHLEAAGVITTGLSQSGVETKNSLGTLIKLRETKEVLGEGLTFEIDALFCNPLGSNLRNHIAHGMLDDQEHFTYDAVYAWWLGFKLAFDSYWQSFHLDFANTD